MSFLEYIGTFEVGQGNNLCLFNFLNKISKLCKPFFIVPPIYDISFKKVFFDVQIGLNLLLDFLNSILFPESNSIKGIKFLMNNKGTRIVDNACIAIIELIENGKKIVKEIIIDIEMENKKIGNVVTQQCFDYGTCLRNENDFTETWVIALCIEEPKIPLLDKNAKSFVTKKLGKNSIAQKMDFVKIYEIYLNSVYYKLDEAKSIINGEPIQNKGKEWIKLFSLSLWCDSVGDNINFCIPSELKFEGEEIKTAIGILGDIQSIEKKRIKIKERSDKEKEKEKYEEGYNDGEKKGFANGKQTGYDSGFSDCTIRILDSFYENFHHGKSIENIELIGKIPEYILKERYGKYEDSKKFAEILEEKNLLIH